MIINVTNLFIKIANDLTTFSMTNDNDSCTIAT